MVDRLVISKIELHGESATITRSLTILEDFSWSISAFGQKVPCFAGFPDKITTMTGVCAVISHLDACITCVGNSDEKFKCLIEERKGNFMDSSGMYAFNIVIQSYLLLCTGCKQIAYCDGFTVASTIRTTSCLVLTLPKNLETESRCSSCHSHRKVLNSMLSRHNKQHSEKLKRKGPEVDSSVLPKCKITHNILGPN